MHTQQAIARILRLHAESAKFCSPCNAKGLPGESVRAALEAVLQLLLAGMHPQLQWLLCMRQVLAARDLQVQPSS